jgi:hypothetical protein
VRDAIEVLGADKNVNLVLNQVEHSGAMGYYYGYPYGDTHRADSGAEKQLP